MDGSRLSGWCHANMDTMKAKITAGAAKVKDAVPDGAALIGLGIAIASISAYVFVVLT
ncbi:MAG: hypothetical protein F2867_04450, partial [Actinobacteria bacterium]|nr:hypothetical protein [Actinomycetota bacterium]